MTEKYLKYVGKFDHALTSIKKLKGKTNVIMTKDCLWSSP
jgi:hypothetical protein